MNVEGIVIQMIKNDSVAYSATGNSLFPEIAPENQARPYVVVSHIDTTPNQTKTGPSIVDNVRVQVDVYADSRSGAAGIAEKIRTALESVFFGSTITVDSTAYTVQGCEMASSSGHYEDYTRCHRQMSDYVLRINR